MDDLTHAQLRALVEAGTPPCVSIFMPTHPAGSGMRQDPIRFKNLLATAEEALATRGMRPTEARDLLEPARAMLDDPEVWSRAESGLAIYLAAGFFRGYRLPVETPEAVHVNDHFAIKPLLPLLTDKRFYVLAVSQKAARLLECSPHGCHPKPLPADVATSLKSAVHADEADSQTLRHAGGGSPRNPQGAAGDFHGEATNFQHQQLEDLRFYFRQLDEGVIRVIDDPDARLVLAGDINVTPLYREVSRHRRLVEETIRGNHEHTADTDLHDRALAVLEPLWEADFASEREVFGTALAQHKASQDLADILTASIDGRVATLYIAPSEARYGHLDPEQRQVEMHDEPAPDDEDLLDQAALRTLLASGRVVVVDREMVPGDGPIAAIYRY